MTAGCSDRLRRGDCGHCAHADPCGRLFAMFGRGGDEGTRRRESTAHPLLDFLGFMLRRAVERNGEHIRTARHGPGAFSRRVEEQLERELEAGRAGIERVARAFGTSRQTLYRRLKDEGVTFAELADRVRRRLATRLLREQHLSVKETAYRLGFSDPAAFSRAFKRWTGRSPKAVRPRRPAH